VVQNPESRIGSSNPAVLFSLAGAPIARRSIAHWHNRYSYPAPEIASELALPAQVSRQCTYLTTDDKRPALHWSLNVTNT
jgi:hypothetical protein